MSQSLELNNTELETRDNILKLIANTPKGFQSFVEHFGDLDNIRDGKALYTEGIEINPSELVDLISKLTGQIELDNLFSNIASLRYSLRSYYPDLHREYNDFELSVNNLMSSDKLNESEKLAKLFNSLMMDAELKTISEELNK